IRVCFLLAVSDLNERRRFMNDTLNGIKWTTKGQPITDRKMVTLASQYNHWAPEVYDFGNSFTHLTNYHDFKHTDPLLLLDSSKKSAIKRYLHAYHSFPNSDEVTFENVVPYIPRVAQKVSDNLNHYLADLERQMA